MARFEKDQQYLFMTGVYRILTLDSSTCGEGSWDVLAVSSTSPTATQVESERELGPARNKHTHILQTVWWVVTGYWGPCLGSSLPQPQSSQSNRKLSDLQHS